MNNMFEKVCESAQFIKNSVKINPEIAIVLGSGLGDLVKEITDKQIIEYKDIPYFPKVTVDGHEGCLVYGKINGVKILAMQGRFHYYEGYSMKEVTYPIYVMKQLGIKQLIITNACGGINTNFEPGTLMIIKDFINLFGDNPLIGINDERFGPRFPDMSQAYSQKLIHKAKMVAQEINLSYEEGVYAGTVGPYYKTAAEIIMIGKMGADAVGMSTVPETIVANYLGIQVLGICCITSMATGIRKDKQSHERVVAVARQASKTISEWIQKIIIEI